MSPLDDPKWTGEAYSKLIGMVWQPPLECQDPEIFRVLRALEVTEWLHELFPGSLELSEALQRWSAEESAIQRIRRATSDPYIELRYRAGVFLILRKISGFQNVAARLLQDDDRYVRSEACKALHDRPILEMEDILVRMAERDPSWEVRSRAISALSRCSPQKAIPVLIRAMEDQEHDDESQAPWPCSSASDGLEEITGWQYPRDSSGELADGFRIGSEDHHAQVKAAAQAYLNRLRTDH